MAGPAEQRAQNDSLILPSDRADWVVNLLKSLRKNSPKGDYRLRSMLKTGACLICSSDIDHHFINWEVKSFSE